MQMFIKRQLVYVKMSVLRKEKVGGAGWDSAGGKEMGAAGQHSPWLSSPA